LIIEIVVMDMNIIGFSNANLTLHLKTESLILLDVLSNVFPKQPSLY